MHLLFLSLLVCAFSYTAPGSKFDLSKWNLQLPVNNVQTISGPKGDLDTYSSKWFWLDQQGKMVFTTITSGNHTPGSKYARSELREIFSSSDPDWSLPSKNGLHVLEATAQVTSCPTSNKKTTLGQIHTVDAKLPIVVELQWVDGKVVVMYSQKDSKNHKYQYFTFNDNVGNGLFKYKILVNNGKMTMQVNSQSKTVDISGWTGTKQYFKAGNYVQSNVGDVLCTAKFSTLCVKHGATSCTNQLNRMEGEEEPVGHSNSLAIGLGVGLGVGFLALVIVGSIAFFAYKKSQHNEMAERV